MAKYRKRPVVIEATQWLPPEDEFDGMPPPPVPYRELRVRYHWFCFHQGRFHLYRKRYQLKTLEGWYWLTPYDWVITGIKGERYPCKPDIFEATYEPVGP